MEQEGRQESSWGTLSIDQMLLEEHLKIIEKMDPGMIKTALDFVITSPFWIELMAVGAVLLLISGFIKR